MAADRVFREDSHYMEELAAMVNGTEGRTGAQTPGLRRLNKKLDGTDHAWHEIAKGQVNSSKPSQTVKQHAQEPSSAEDVIPLEDEENLARF